MEINCSGSEFELKNGSDVILQSSPDRPMIYVGRGKENVLMYRGNFKIEDYVEERRPLFITEVSKTRDGAVLTFGDDLKAEVSDKDGAVVIRFEKLCDDINRFWIRVNSDAGEHVYGCGEQMSYFDMKGRHFPLWTGEPGVGRDKSTYITWKSDVDNMAGGDYYNTNFPQTTFVSSRKYYLHVQTTAYADFDFRND
ncbi:MAG: alpha-glucosidase, partial [Butyrivibrio sp.]|nr:alpha-glucosidase [Butyrivibrio sp.]